MLPSIRMGDWVLTEPATLATDYIMAVLSAFWAWVLLRQGQAGSAKFNWGLSFACLSFTSFVGGTYHGFQQMFPGQIGILWNLVLVGTSFGSFFLLKAALSQFLPQREQKTWARAAWVKLGLSLVWGILQPVFLVALVDFALGMVLICVLVFPHLHRHQRSFLLFGAGVFFFAIGGLVQQLKWAPHFYFNHNDLFHVIQLFGNYMFYSCARE